ncbi:MAG: glycosyltransferase family 4 protein [Gammaproteobacteria bacterium]|nr:glycosyltransferase family 4 protein [Gammaproteobacteria bacterium]MDH3767563.1 glycosyltransferase family 4 protein [Gammaproteobacteria bacterium]
MKVLHVESGRHLYGGAVQVLLLLRGLRAEGVENVLVCPTGSEIAAAAPEADLREISMGGDLDVGLISRMRRIIAETRPDIIHLHSRRGADWIGGLAALRLGVPVVLSRRVDNRERRLFATAKYSLVDRIIAISRGIQKVLIDAGVSADKVACVPDAVPPMGLHQRDRVWFEMEFGVHATVPTIGVIAQLIPRKGHRFFLDAVPDLLRTTPDLRVVFFGRGETELDLRNQITRLGLDNVVTMPGFRDDLMRIFPCLDLVVHPALSEGLGVALLQASQAGLPVVASRVGGIPEAIIDGKTGVLVPPSDVAALTEAVNSILADASWSRQLGANAAAHVAAHFGVEQMVAGNLAVYRAI